MGIPSNSAPNDRSQNDVMFNNIDDDGIDDDIDNTDYIDSEPNLTEKHSMYIPQVPHAFGQYINNKHDMINKNRYYIDDGASSNHQTIFNKSVLDRRQTNISSQSSNILQYAIDSNKKRNIILQCNLKKSDNKNDNESITFSTSNIIKAIVTGTDKTKKPKNNYIGGYNKNVIDQQIEESVHELQQIDDDVFTENENKNGLLSGPRLLAPTSISRDTTNNISSDDSECSSSSDDETDCNDESDEIYSPSDGHVNRRSTIDIANDIRRDIENNTKTKLKLKSKKLVKKTKDNVSVPTFDDGHHVHFSFFE